MPMQVFYYLPTVAVSLLRQSPLPQSLYLWSAGQRCTYGKRLPASVVMGGGIGSDATTSAWPRLRCAAVISYDIGLVVLSVRTGDRDLISLVEARFPGAG